MKRIICFFLGHKRTYNLQRGFHCARCGRPDLQFTRLVKQYRREAKMQRRAAR